MPQQFKALIVTFEISAMLVLLSLTALAQQPRAQRSNTPQNLFDPRLAELRVASVAWAGRVRPSRDVTDVVCLVPDMPTFLEAISTWDANHFFPILIDDATYSLKFLRAFKPARVIRFPKKPAPPKPDEL